MNRVRGRRPEYPRPIRFPKLHDRAFLADRLRKGWSHLRIARLLGCSAYSVRDAILRLGISAEARQGTARQRMRNG